MFLPAPICGGAQVSVTIWLKTLVPPTYLVLVALLAIPGALTFGILFALFFIENDERALLREKFLRRNRKVSPTLAPGAGAG
ncbi:MAG: hypothetical protein H8F28_26010 [Fibrella sp.]|nr:hypothetical protein [Armatimonadota bacterium]